MRSRDHKRLPNHVLGSILVAIIVVGAFLAYTKRLPWSHGYTVKAVFTTAENIRTDSPVRIAGVNVGEVTDVQHLSAADAVDEPGARPSPAAGRLPAKQAAIVTMEIEDEGLPVHEDATFRLRPRLFLEGNLFVDLHPGSPGAPEAPAGYEFPLRQTSVAVQLDQVLATLQWGVRRNLQIFLREFGDALIRHHGAGGLRQLYETSPGAYRNTALVNQALLGTRRHDLSGLVKNLDSTVRALDAEQSGLQGLVTHLRTVTGSFAAQDQALAAAIGELPRFLAVGRPALAELSDSFPPLRAFAREALPGVRSTPATLDAATPVLNQVRGLVSRAELRGLVHDLRPTIPRLAKLTNRTIPFLDQSRALASCFNQVVIPWSNSSVPDPDIPPPTVSDATGTHPATVFEETGYGLVGIAGESRSGDANGEYIRVEAGGGANTPNLPGPINGGGQIIEDVQPASQTVPFVGYAESEIEGSRPNLSAGSEDSLKTPFRPAAPCERQQRPNLESSPGPAPEQVPVSSVGGASSLASPLARLGSTSRDYAVAYLKSLRLSAAGKAGAANSALKKAGSEWLRFKGHAKPHPRPSAAPSEGVSDER
jgi:phospholipid/cholesterol/gamma-HCH transport system substrate-binding protein